MRHFSPEALPLKELEKLLNLFISAHLWYFAIVYFEYVSNENLCVQDGGGKRCVALWIATRSHPNSSHTDGSRWSRRVQMHKPPFQLMR